MGGQAAPERPCGLIWLQSRALTEYTCASDLYAPTWLALQHLRAMDAIELRRAKMHESPYISMTPLAAGRPDAAVVAAGAAVKSGDPLLEPLLCAMVREQHITNQLLLAQIGAGAAACQELRGIRRHAGSIAASAAAMRASLDALLRVCQSELRPLADAARLALSDAASAAAGARLASAVLCGRSCALASLLLAAPRAAGPLAAAACARRGARAPWRAAMAAAGRAAWAAVGGGPAVSKATSKAALLCGSAALGEQVAPMRVRAAPVHRWAEKASL